MARTADLDIRRPTRSRRLLGLFEEAWRRQRRRRRRAVLVVVAALIAAVVLVRLHLPSGRRAIPAPARVSRLSSGGLPASGHFASLTQVGGRLIVAGGPGGVPLTLDGTTTTLVDGRARGECTAAVVVSGTVRVGPLDRANCGDPALYGLHALPILFDGPPHVTGALMGGVRIAVADRGARDGYRLGPTVMSYTACSDCGARWIIGDNSLWILGPFAHDDRHLGELLRISTATGDVLQRLTVPGYVDPLLAVDRSGLWIAPSIASGFPAARSSRALRRAYGSLLLAAPGARRVRQVLGVGDTDVTWLAATADRVWLERERDGVGRIATFTGARADDLRLGPPQHVGRYSGDEPGEEQTVAFAPAATTGVDAVVAPDDDEQAIVAYDTLSLTEHVLARIAQPDAYDEVPDAAVGDGAFYALDPVTTSPSGATPAELFRLAAP